MGRLADFFREQSIALAGQQKVKMLSLDREFEDMAAERDALKTENLHLKAEVNPLKRDIERMQNEVQRAKAAAAARDEKLQALDPQCRAFHAGVGGYTVVLICTVATCKATMDTGALSMSRAKYAGDFAEQIARRRCPIPGASRSRRDSWGADDWYVRYIIAHVLRIIYIM